jgi:hypothetical protein
MVQKLKIQVSLLPLNTNPAPCGSRLFRNIKEKSIIMTTISQDVKEAAQA